MSKVSILKIELYGLWNIGAVGVFLEQKNACKNKNLNTKTLNYEGDLIKRIQLYTPKFIPKYKALLNEDAIAIVSSDKTVFISHYALLINASGLQKLLNLRSKQRFFCDLNPGTSFWVVICAILPVYSLATFTSFNPSVVITFENIDINKGYRLRKDWEKLDDYKLNDLAVCKENSAIFAINKKPIHLTDYKIIDDELWLKGHSLMNGYLEKDKMVFKDDYLIIKKNKF
jgi:hypothetical protein